MTRARRTGTVHLVEDDPLVADYLASQLRSHGLEVQTYPTSERFQRDYRSRSPECLLLDLRLPGDDGLKLMRHLKDGGRRIPVVMMTGYGDTRTAVESMKLGAIEFLEKPFQVEEVLEAVEEALDKDEPRGRNEALLDTLSPREREVLDLVVQGLSSKEIAGRLSLSKKTVDVHRSNLLRKLEADTAVDLVRIYLSSR